MIIKLWHGLFGHKYEPAWIRDFIEEHTDDDMVDATAMAVQRIMSISVAYTIVEDKTPKRKVCGRCGATPAEVRKMGWDCTHYGIKYDHHFWVKWEPYSGT